MISREMNSTEVEVLNLIINRASFKLDYQPCKF